MCVLRSETERRRSDRQKLTEINPGADTGKRDENSEENRKSATVGPGRKTVLSRRPVLYPREIEEDEEEEEEGRMGFFFR